MNQILIDDKAFLLKSYLRCSHCNGMDIFEPELTQMPLLPRTFAFKGFYDHHENP